MVYSKLYLKSKTKITLNERFSRLAKARNDSESFQRNPYNTNKNTTVNRNKKFESFNRQKSQDLIRKSRTFYNKRNQQKFPNYYKNEQQSFQENNSISEQYKENHYNKPNYSNLYNRQNNENFQSRRQIQPYSYQTKTSFNPTYNKRSFQRIPRYNNNRFQNENRRDISFHENDNYFND